MSNDQGGRRICLFGGTFDPIHNAHLGIALEAARRFNLTEVLFVPAGNPPHKVHGQITPFDARYDMVELACAENPLFVASRLEGGEGISYSIDTVEALQEDLAPQDKLFFLIGSDAFDEIDTWHRYEDLLRSLEFIVVARPGNSYRTPPGAMVHRLDGLSMPISSSDIRARLADGSATPELPSSVRLYIEQHGLYNAGQGVHR